MHHEIPPRKDLIGNGCVLQLANDPKHTASTVNKKHTHTHWEIISHRLTFPESTLQHYGSSVGSSWQGLQQKGSQHPKKNKRNIPQEYLKKLQKNLPSFGLYTVFLCMFTHVSGVCPWDTCYKCTSCSLNMCNFARNSYFKKRIKYISIANFLLGFVFVHHSAKDDLCVCLFSYRWKLF